MIADDDESVTTVLEILGLLESAKCSIFNGLRNDTI